MLNQLYQFVEQSLQDRKLTRNELSVFRQLLSEADLDARERDLLRRRIYELAYEQLKDPRDRDVLSWIEEFHKALDHLFTPQKQQMEALFFPSEDSYQRVIQVLKGAKQSLDICVFTITDDRITDVLFRHQEAGLPIRVITDDDKAADLGSDVIDLARQGMSVRFDNSPDHMHHKFAIIDRRLLLTGSFNWTRSASLRNQENLIITDQPALVASFQQEFDKLWHQFSPENR